MVIDMRTIIGLLNTFTSLVRKIKEITFPWIWSYVTMKTTENREKNIFAHPTK